MATPITFRMGVPLPESESDRRGTVTPRPEIRPINEELLRNDDLGAKNSMNVPPSDTTPYDPAVYRDGNNQP
jgi:hypothetical protein